MPWSRQKRRTSRAPSSEWSPPRPLAMSWNSAAMYSTQGLSKLDGELRAERVLVRVLGDEEAAHVAQHHQDVLVDRVDVEQVVLHLADDAAEHPQVAAEHDGLVHQPEGVRLAARLPSGSP